MSYFFDQYGPRRRANAQRSDNGRGDSLALQQAVLDLERQLDQRERENEELKLRVAQQVKELRDQTQALEIKSDALRKQSEELKRLETELVFTRAAVRDAEQKQEETAGDGTWQERYLRLQAELENLRKRLEQRYAADTAEHRRQILADMLPLADHLDLALQHAPETDDTALGNFIRNIEATRRAFLDTLRRYDVERLESLNAPFDPARHEAIGQIDSPDVPEDHVAQVVQAGYREGDRILRPARVLISTGTRGQR